MLFGTDIEGPSDLRMLYSFYSKAIAVLQLAEEERNSTKAETSLVDLISRMGIKSFTDFLHSIGLSSIRAEDMLIAINPTIHFSLIHYNALLEGIIGLQPLKSIYRTSIYNIQKKEKTILDNNPLSLEEEKRLLLLKETIKIYDNLTPKENDPLYKEFIEGNRISKEKTILQLAVLKAISADTQSSLAIECLNQALQNFAVKQLPGGPSEALQRSIRYAIKGYHLAIKMDSDLSSIEEKDLQTKLDLAFKRALERHSPATPSIPNIQQKNVHQDDSHRPPPSLKAYEPILSKKSRFEDDPSKDKLTISDSNKNASLFPPQPVKKPQWVAPSKGLNPKDLKKAMLKTKAEKVERVMLKIEGPFSRTPMP